MSQSHQYRKKPVVIEAFRVLDKLPEDPAHTPQWLIEAVIAGEIGVIMANNSSKFSVKTTEGTMTGNVGDWIIKGVKDELYICTDEIFQMTYDKVIPG
jgi:hypothetical protein